MSAVDVVVGSGGVGKTSIAAALAIASARRGERTLVMTFDPSRRLKDALGVGERAADQAVGVTLDPPAPLDASLLDAKATFDRLVERHAPSDEERDRILHNRFYSHLSGSLAGILEYMAVERLHEIAETGRYDRIVLDTPPTHQAIEFLEAPDRVVSFLDSGALRIALKSWFDESGRLRPTRRLGLLGRQVERFFDTIVGLDLLRDMAEFFQSFAPLYAGFREHALAVRKLLTGPTTRFVLVTGPARGSIPDTMVLARRLVETGHVLGPVIVNRIHPRVETQDRLTPEVWQPGIDLLAWLAERDAAGVEELRSLLGRQQRLVTVPELVDAPGDVASLETLAVTLERQLGGSSGRVAGRR